MINLIPSEGKKIVAREYWVRVVSVWAILFFGISITILLLLIPTYVLVNAQLEALQGEIREGSDTEENFVSAEDEVKMANTIIDQLSMASPEMDISDVIQKVSAETGNEIELRRFEIKRDGLFIKTFQVQGSAMTREALAEFKSRLEGLPLFDSVDLPISDLARDTNLSFAVTITLSTQE